MSYECESSESAMRRFFAERDTAQRALDAERAAREKAEAVAELEAELAKDAHRTDSLHVVLREIRTPAGERVGFDLRINGESFHGLTRAVAIHAAISAERAARKQDDGNAAEYAWRRAEDKRSAERSARIKAEAECAVMIEYVEAPCVVATDAEIDTPSACSTCVRRR